MAAILADIIFKCISWKENIYILIPILPRFVPKGPALNKPMLDHVMAWLLTGDKPLSKPMLVKTSAVTWYLYMATSHYLYQCEPRHLLSHGIFTWQQAIIYTNVSQDICCHMVSLHGNKPLSIPMLAKTSAVTWHLYMATSHYLYQC